MVPGMTERDLKMADLRRAEWLAETAREQRWADSGVPRPGIRREPRPRPGLAAALGIVFAWRPMCSGPAAASVHRTAAEGQ